MCLSFLDIVVLTLELGQKKSPIRVGSVLYNIAVALLCVEVAGWGGELGVMDKVVGLWVKRETHVHICIPGRGQCAHRVAAGQGVKIPPPN